MNFFADTFVFPQIYLHIISIMASYLLLTNRSTNQRQANKMKLARQ